MADRQQYIRYRQDAKVLAAIGDHVAAQAGRVTVRLPRVVAEAAMRAWERDEHGGLGEETPAERTLRDRAAELALIGLAILQRGRWDGEHLVIDLDVDSAGAALRASR